MEVFFPSREEFESVQRKVDKILEYMISGAKPEEKIFTNQQFIEMMNISDKTAAAWRKAGKIGFTQEDRRVFYRLSDILLFMEKYHVKPDSKLKSKIRLK